MTSDYFFYIFYSMIQGVTEFIPISSSGHLNLLELLHGEINSRNYLYETTAHFSSLLALPNIDSSQKIFVYLHPSF